MYGFTPVTPRLPLTTPAGAALALGLVGLEQVEVGMAVYRGG